MPTKKNNKAPVKKTAAKKTPAKRKPGEKKVSKKHKAVKEPELKTLDNTLIIMCKKCNGRVVRSIELPKNRIIKCVHCKNNIKVNTGQEGY